MLHRRGGFQQGLEEGPSGEVMFKSRFERQGEVSQARNKKESMSCRGPAYGWKERGALEELKEVLVELTELWEDWDETRLEMSSGVK